MECGVCVNFVFVRVCRYLLNVSTGTIVMLALVYFEGVNYYQVYPANNVINIEGTVCTVKHQGVKYRARLITYHSSRVLLESLAENLSTGKPKIVLEDAFKSSRNTPIETPAVIEVLSEEDTVDLSLDIPILFETPAVIEVLSEDTVDYLSSDMVTEDILEVRDGNIGNEENTPVLTHVSQEGAPSVSIPQYQYTEDIHTCDEELLTREIIPPNMVKKACCLYCKKLVSKITRHLENLHADEADVKAFTLLPRGCMERKKIIETIRRRGNFIHNTVNDHNAGFIITCRRPRKHKTYSADDYECCAHCKGFFAKGTLYRHFQKCNPHNTTGNRNVIALGRRIHGKIHHKACQTLKDKVFPVLREDDITKLIRYDELLILYANSLCSKYRSQHNHNMIRARLRLLGRFLLEIRKKDKTITDFMSVFDPAHYDAAIAAVNAVARLSYDCYEAPTPAFQMGTLLKQTGNILLFECIKKKDNDRKEQVKDFLKLLQVDFGTSINKTVIENQLQRKRNKSVRLPSTDDIKTFTRYLNNNRQKYYYELKNSFSFTTWKCLAEYTLTSVQVFNRRRAGEIERILISDFEKYQTVNEETDKDIYESLSQEMRNKAANYVRFTIRGKLGRSVPVLLHKQLVECINLIIKHRQEAKVPKDNPYVFGLPEKRKGCFNYLSACSLMRKFSEACGAKNPSLLRGTQLRKHIATQSVIYNLQENEISDLASFMGHAEKIHRDHYRMPVVTREITMMSQLLEKAQGNLEEISSNENNIAETNDLRTLDVNPARKRKTRSSSPLGPVKRTSWSSEERIVAEKIFDTNLRNECLPSLSYCAEVISTHSQLHDRTPKQLYAWVNNQIKGKQSKEIGSPLCKSTPHLKKGRVLIPWGSGEKKVMREFFKQNLSSNKLPSLNKCDEILELYPDVLKARKSTTIKAWVNNQIKKKIKHQLRSEEM